MLVGLEYREESFEDLRDPRLNENDPYTNQWDTYPFVSAVANSSPTPDSSGEQNTTSCTELQLPILDNLNAQVAIRHEDFSVIDDNATVGKVAFGWQFDEVLFRASYQTALRAPNLVTLF